jgi:hypothetical protein
MLNACFNPALIDDSERLEEEYDEDEVGLLFSSSSACFSKSPMPA